MPQYTREQIYEAMRRADAAGDGDAVRALAAQLQSMGGQSSGRTGFGRARSAEPQQPARAAAGSVGAQTAEAGASRVPDREPDDGYIGSGFFRIPTRLDTLAYDVGIGAGSAVEGAGDVVGIAANPVGQLLYNATGRNEAYDAGQIVREATGLPRIEDPVQHEAFAGMGGALTGAGTARAVAQGAGNVTRNALAPLFATPVRDTVAGGAAGAAIAATADQGPFVQAGAGMAAALLGHKVAGAADTTANAFRGNALAGNTPEAQAVRFGQENNAPIYTTDVRPPRGFTGRVVQATGERIPYAGTGGMRTAQNEARVRLVRELADDYGIGAESSPDYLAAVSENLTATRAGRLRGFTNAKNQIIDGIDAPFTGAPNTVRAISEQVRRLRDIDAEEFAPVIERLQRFGERLQSGNLTLRQVEEQRRLLGDMFADPNLAAIQGRGQQSVNAIYGPLREDMGDFIQSTAGSRQREAWQRANNQLAAMAGELDVSTFRSVLRDADATPEGVARLLFSRRPSDVRRLMENLGPEGQQNARSAIVYEVLRRAGTDSELRNISPNRVASTMQRMGDTIGVAFEGNEATRLQGLERFLDMTRRAADASAAPPTGVQNTQVIGGAVLTDLLGGLGAATTSAGMMGLMARAYESAAVRNALLRLGRQEPNSRAAMNSTIQVVRIMQAEGLLNAVNDNAAVIGNAAAQEDDQ